MIEQVFQFIFNICVFYEEIQEMSKSQVRIRPMHRMERSQQHTSINKPVIIYLVFTFKLRPLNAKLLYLSQYQSTSQRIDTTRLKSYCTQIRTGKSQKKGATNKNFENVMQFFISQKIYTYI